MATIKQEILQKITNEVTDLKFAKKLDAANLKIRKALQLIIKKRLGKLEFPKELIDEGYIYTNTSISMAIGYGKWPRNITVDPFPCKYRESDDIKRNETPQLEKACQSLVKLEEEIDTYRSKFRQTLFALKTDKRIVENLPELEPYLIKHKITPPLATNAIIPVSLIEEMRCDIKTLVKKGEK